MIASIILPALFVSSGLFALGTLVLAWRTHGNTIRAIRHQLAATSDFREARISIALTETREYLPVVRRNALRPRQTPQPPRLAPLRGQRAAA